MGMGKKAAKGRLDKYYYLAKEQGYRARSAYKLIQLDRSFNFLKKAKCLIDLCAAPGGWLQVASKHMPTPNLIVGVDLAAIKPIPGVITIQQDITTDKCRNELRQHLKTWSADVVLHDGAPNVGSSWLQDAYSQAELVLMSLKLATEFLNKGGTFVTKVFRSKDYNNLLWVFQQLFGKVEATKPESSRNVSAEIFVVCRDYLAPKSIDPKFLDPRHVFQDLDVLNQASSASKNVFQADLNKRHRDGYEENVTVLYKTISVADFIKGSGATEMLGTFNAIVAPPGDTESAEIMEYPVTTNEVKACMSDLRVLNKKDYKGLIKWRLAVLKCIDLKEKAAGKEEDEEMHDGEGEEEKTAAETALGDGKEYTQIVEASSIAEELAMLEAERQNEQKRDKRKENRKKRKLIERMQLGMLTPTDIGLEQEAVGADDLFDRDELVNSAMSDRDAVGASLGDDDEGDFSELSDSDEFEYSDESEEYSDSEDERLAAMEREADRNYSDVTDRRMEKKERARQELEKKRKFVEDDKPWSGIVSRGKDDGDDDDDEDDSDDSDKEGGYPGRQRGQDISSDDDEDDDEEDDEEETPNYVRLVKKNSGGKKRVRFALEGGNEENEERILSAQDQDQEYSSDEEEEEVLDSAELKRREKKAAAANIFFDQNIFKEFAEFKNQVATEKDDEVNEEELMMMMDEDDEEEEEDEEFDDKDDEQSDDSEDIMMMEDDDQEEEGSEEIPQLVPIKEKKSKKPVEKKQDKETEEKSTLNVNDFKLSTPSAIAMAMSLVNREKTTHDIIDEGFSRYNFNDREGLPSWFADDEKRNYKANIPITKEAMDEMRARMKQLDARPIKKVAEAKAKKRRRVSVKMAKLTEKADSIAQSGELSEREKSNAISKMMAKAKSSVNKRDKIQLVVARGANKGSRSRPKGVKGRYKMVDKRMKKEVLAQKRRAKTVGRGKKKKSSK